MGVILSSTTKEAIRAAIRLVTTGEFCDTPIVYHLAKESLDPWQEDRADQKFDNYPLKALEDEYLSGTDKQQINLEKDGGKDYEEVRLLFNFEDVEEAGLIGDDYVHRFTQELDYFTMKGKVYKVLDIWYDGPIDKKPALIMMTARLTDRKIEV